MKRTIPALLSALAVAGCTGSGAKNTLAPGGPSPRAIAMLQTVNEKAQTCWVKSGDKDFQGLAIIPELDTRTGNPRLLVVERGKATGLPKLVIEASGNPVTTTTYGPLMASAVSARITGDVAAWSAGRTSC
ncbi:MAG: hypothetical protein WAU86_00970 [Oricola sp.]